MYQRQSGHGCSLSIVLPAYNIADLIEKTLSDSYRFLMQQTIFRSYEVIVVDDGSVDGTDLRLQTSLSRYSCLSVETHRINKGYGAAIVTGIRKAQYPLILVMDADGQFHISSLVQLHPFTDQYEIVTGYRRQRRDAIHRILLGNLYTFVARCLFGLDLKDVNCGFKLFWKDKVRFEKLNCHAGIFYTDFFLQARQNGCGITQFPVDHYPRQSGGQTGASINVLFKSLKDLFRIYGRRP